MNIKLTAALLVATVALTVLVARDPVVWLGVALAVLGLLVGVLLVLVLTTVYRAALPHSPPWRRLLPVVRERRLEGPLPVVVESCLPGVEAGKSRESAQSSLRTLERFQCGDGGFAFWPGQCASVSPYLTSYVIHVFQRAQKLGYTVDPDMLTRAYEYLD